MNQTIDLVTDGQPKLTPEAAGILAAVIRKAVAGQRHHTGRSTVECHIARRS